MGIRAVARVGCRGAYDAVRRYAASWYCERSVMAIAPYVPLSFTPGEAYQSDWRHEVEPPRCDHRQTRRYLPAQQMRELLQLVRIRSRIIENRFNRTGEVSAAPLTKEDRIRKFAANSPRSLLAYDFARSVSAGSP